MKKPFLSYILISVFAVYAIINPAFAFDIPIYEENFESSLNWSAENGVWEVGMPTSGPGDCHGGSNCAGTILAGDYPGHTDSVLIVFYREPWDQGVELPDINVNEELHLRFWNWFSYSSYDSGQVQISVKDPVTSQWGPWEDVGGAVTNDSGGWSKKDVEITNYAGQTIRIGFSHVAERNYYGHASEGPGWYIDDIQIVVKIPEFTGDFEMGWVDWSASTGVWQVGTPSTGPEECYDGDQCAGTVLDAIYPGYTDSRLVSATIDLSSTSVSTVYLKYWEWFSYSSYDYGELQISVWNSETEQWSDWESLLAQSSGISPVWTLKNVDLSDYSGETFRIGFFHVAERNYYGHASESHGWYIDNLELIGPTQIMPIISSVSFAGYIPDPCTSLIDVFASDIFDDDLTYVWQLPDGMILESADDNLEFIPPEIRVEPYQIRVAAWSDVTNLSSFTKTLTIFTEVLFDLDDDDDIDGRDLYQFANTFVVEDLERFAQEFGLVACQ